jgi:hypothetical protein
VKKISQERCIFETAGTSAPTKKKYRRTVSETTLVLHTLNTIISGDRLLLGAVVEIMTIFL